VSDVIDAADSGGQIFPERLQIASHRGNDAHSSNYDTTWLTHRAGAT
jgi:hypothetical protein